VIPEHDKKQIHQVVINWQSTWHIWKSSIR